VNRGDLVERASGTLCVLLSCAAVGFAGTAHAGPPPSTAEAEGVKVSKDYFAQFREEFEQGVFEECALHLYQELATKLTPTPAGIKSSVSVKPTGEYWGALVEWDSVNRQVIDAAFSAASRPYLGMPFERDAHVAEKTSQEPVQLRLLPLDYIKPIRRATHAMSLHGHVAIQTKDGQRAHDAFRALLGTAEQINRSPILVCQLVGLATLQTAVDLAGRVLEESPGLWSAERWETVSRDLTNALGGGTLRWDNRFEVASHHDEVQRLYSDDGEGDGHLTFHGIRLLDAIVSPDEASSDAPWKPGKLETLLFENDVFAGHFRANIAGRRELVAELERRSSSEMWKVRPWQCEEWPDAYADRDEDTKKQYRDKYMIAGILIGDAYRLGWKTYERVIMQRDGLRFAIAIELHRRTHGELPSSADAVDHAVQSTCIDGISGQPLGYVRRDDGTFAVYSVGADGDDDGGTGSEDVTSVVCWRPVAERHKAGDGDWILWPRARR
jgi:hypothetical protein